ncbi:1,4-alpha-glucan branching enzyme GlgB [Petrocella atlantisensis]|uniref:1,4-alpha-glucan branching enzyme GlgB n=1 Tax=Petrocella atlantisensis TaxID=2173034 RepID=A0A3P7S384_9FIRM|nr:1,4-alpha-glucan branching protein GlgB [Petrocella atlantisensis]VDN49082.1 1,4-alpha-glucan branching enzyme GlgB [Petrocella atlantisensis]
MEKYINEVEMAEILGTEHRDPHHFLGMHQQDGIYYVNAYKPSAFRMEVLDLTNQKQIKMTSVNDSGIFTAVVGEQPISYKLKIVEGSGYEWETYDAYAFEPVIQELDMYLFGNGTHYEIYKKLGAHLITIDGVSGVHFAVWAPNAKRVSVIGDFCGWDGRVYPLRNVSNSGIYEIFIPGLEENEKYKFEIKTQANYILEKSDPYANYAEFRPNTASVVTNLEGYEWQDDAYKERKASMNVLNQPISIYEVHLGSWKKAEGEPGYMNYRDIAEDLIGYVKEMGYTHIELMPIAEHPFDGSWGYQVTGYFAPTSRFGTPKDFMYFVDRCHQNDIGVILDWVPAHFPKDAHGLVNFDGTALYEHEDPRKGEHPHWGTMIFNYGRNEVNNFLIANAFYWINEFHIDGLRVDAVASMLYLDYGKDYGEWIPNPHGGRENYDAIDFFKHLNSILYKDHPDLLMIAEESTSWPGVSRPTNYGGLGFGLKWNMGWMNDFLRYLSFDPIHRQYHHNDLTFSMVYAFTENFALVLSHDEVVHGKGSMINKMPGDYWQKFANLRAAYGFMYVHPGKKLMFMGCEFAQFDEWSENKSLDWHLLEFEKHQQMQRYVKDLNRLYLDETALWFDDFTSEGFEWINCMDYATSIISLVRKSNQIDETLIAVVNFTPVPRTLHKIGVPYKGYYEEIFNSDDFKYGGSGVINTGTLTSFDERYDERDQTLSIKVPPLGMTVLKYKG